VGVEVRLAVDVKAGVEVRLAVDVKAGVEGRLAVEVMAGLSGSVLVCVTERGGVLVEIGGLLNFITTRLRSIPKIKNEIEIIIYTKIF
jgi:hypothetical protein